MLYHELSTVTDVRSVYNAISGTSDDALFLNYIRDVSAEIEDAAHRSFVPRIETRYFDAALNVHGRGLVLDDDLFSITTLTNGDATTVSASDYVTQPRNGTSFWKIELLGSSGLSWTYTTDPENAISLAGVWGYDCSWLSRAYSQWVQADTLAAAITTASATTYTLTTSGSVKGGQLLKIDSEYIYSGLVSGTAGTAAVRGVNGSTAATHLILAPVYVWKLYAPLEQLAIETATGLYRLRANPTSETYIAADGTQFVTPKDIHAYIPKRVTALGLVRN